MGSEVSEKNELPDSTKTTSTATDGNLMQECLIKHPLQNQWTLWYFEYERRKEWTDMQNAITTFDTVEDFWSLYNHIKLASEIRPGNDYSVFKNNIRPMWEDDANKRGGKWTINLDAAQRYLDLDNMWLDLLLCMIGEVFDNSDEICGAVVNIRPKGDRIAIWTADYSNREAVLNIGHKLKECLRLDQSFPIHYETHKDSAAKKSRPILTL